MVNSTRERGRLGARTPRINGSRGLRRDGAGDRFPNDPVTYGTGDGRETLGGTSWGQTITHVAAPWKTRLAQAAARLRADLAFALIDAVIIVFAYTAALVLRFIDIQSISPKWWQGFLIVLPIVLVVHLTANLIFGAYGHVWEFASVEEAMRLVAAAVSSAGLLLIGLLVYRSATGGSDGLVPVMVLVVGAGLTLGGMGAVRFRSRLFSFKRTQELPEPAATLVVGTGRAAADLARHGPGNGFPARIVGFVSGRWRLVAQAPGRPPGTRHSGRRADHRGNVRYRPGGHCRLALRR